MAKIEKIYNDDLIDYQWQTSEDPPGAPEEIDTGPGCTMSVIMLVAAVIVCSGIALGIGWVLVKLIQFWAMRGVL